MFRNKHGQDPSPPLPEDHSSEEPKVAMHPRVAMHRARMQPNRVMLRAGHEPIDTKQCQAPVRTRPGNMHATRCVNPAVCVAVENNPRHDGRIAALSLCAFHRDALLATQGPDYAEITVLA